MLYSRDRLWEIFSSHLSVFFQLNINEFTWIVLTFLIVKVFHSIIEHKFKSNNNVCIIESVIIFTGIVFIFNMFLHKKIMSTIGVYYLESSILGIFVFTSYLISEKNRDLGRIFIWALIPILFFFALYDLASNQSDVAYICMVSIVFGWLFFYLLQKSNQNIFVWVVISLCFVFLYTQRKNYYAELSFSSIVCFIYFYLLHKNSNTNKLSYIVIYGVVFTSFFSFLKTGLGSNIPYIIGLFFGWMFSYLLRLLNKLNLLSMTNHKSQSNMNKNKSIQVFISYAREDYKFANKLFNSLDLISGVKPWLDRKELLPGMNWEDEILQAIENSQFIIVLTSENSIDKRGFIQKEIKESLEQFSYLPPRKIFLIPARLDETIIKHREFKKIQWVNMFPRWDDGINKIEQSIKIQIVNNN